MKHNIFENSVKSVLNEQFESDGNFYVYHGTDSAAIQGLLSAGFERSWSGSGGGNMYGKGVYTTFTWSTRGCNARGNYGHSVVKALVKSLKNFIIYDKDIAVRVYGEYNLDKQLLNVFGQSFVDDLKSFSGHCCAPNGGYPPVNYDIAANHIHTDKTSNCAYGLAAFINERHRDAEFQMNGYIFCGGHDADVCFIKDFKNVYPIEVSNDLGKTFRPITDNKGDRFDKFAKNDIDLHFQLGKLNYKLYKELDEFPNYFINNYARVKKGGKYNFLWRGRSLKLGVISPVWFDGAPETFSNAGRALVTIDDNPFIIVNDKGLFLVYSSEGQYLCKLDELETFLNDFSYADEFDEEF